MGSGKVYRAEPHSGPSIINIERMCGRWAPVESAGPNPAEEAHCKHCKYREDVWPVGSGKVHRTEPHCAGPSSINIERMCGRSAPVKSAGPNPTEEAQAL